LPIEPVWLTATTAADTPSMNSTWPLNARSRGKMGWISAGSPSTSSTLAMLLPTMLPIATPENPFSPAYTEVRSSGAEVPNATTVRPTTTGEIEARFDRPSAPRTSKSPPSSR
jgi:hypothetical protein